MRLRSLLLLLGIAVCGCSVLPSHIHNSARASRTAKLAGLVDQYGEKSPGIYDTLLKSSRAIAAEQDKVLAGLGANQTNAITTTLPFDTGADLAATHDRVCTTLNKSRANLIKAVHIYLNAKSTAEQDAKAADDAINAAQQRVDIAKENVTNWNATIAVLEAGIAEVPSSRNSSGDGKTAGIDTLQKRLQAAGDREVQYVDANGDKHKQKISQILKNQIDVKSDGKPLLNIPDAPGATLAILTLGVDLARIEKQRAGATLAELSRRLQLYERVKAEMDLAYALLGDSCDSRQKLASYIVAKEDSFVGQAALLAYETRAAEQAAASSAKSVSGESEQQRKDRIVPEIRAANMQMLALFGDLVKLRQLAIAEAIATRTSLDLEVSEPRLAHEESILDSKVNDVAWRTVIRSGVVVLDQYEQGGFTAQDAADIVAIAQAIAVGVLAGRVH